MSGFVLFSVLCGAGQICYSSIYNYRQRLILKSSNQDQLQPFNTSSQDSNIQNEKKKLGFLDRLAAIKWSPITKLSEEQYKEHMKAKEEKRLGDSNKTKNNDE
ncbi:2824_t:CDS:1 [Funneliformis caledonium]|uniref:2824_t:CDS:1 n=2 Tax=Funneliformis TaxID=1117308 RepID=A0A9N9CV76_9GLOM|nr:2273_t:CDS:1 [Funneliformis mosseae]CAG8612338.1 2824_t:CDS:1 [Funneliformis caledonium]